MEQADGSTRNKPLILVVEDEPKIAGLLSDYLLAERYSVHILYEGNGVVEYVRENLPDLVVLDHMLPGKDGLTLTREIRSFSTVPIIMVTARVEEVDRLLGLELGADDYICKPFSPREVIARIRAVLRRSASHTGIHAKSNPQEDNRTSVQTEPAYENKRSGLWVDELGFIAGYGDKRIELTPAEFRLLLIFSKAPGRAFSREQLLDALYDDQRIVTDRTIDTHIKNLRRKLELSGAGDCGIVSVYGVGYRFEC